MRRFIFIVFLLIQATTAKLYSQQLKDASGAFVFPDSITVKQDGTGNFKTIQAAVNAVRDLGQKRVFILIKNGVYHEKLIVPSWKTNMSLIGESSDSTIITNNDYSGKLYANGPDAFGRDKFNTYTSYTVLVQGNGFVAENLTIENTAGRVGQAVALHIEADRAIIKNCKLLGNQDTLYTATGNSRQYYLDCYIEGTTDFIFGEATVYFENCTIKSLTDSYVTAAATTKFQLHGFVLVKCKLIADNSLKKVYLGRPWRPYAKTIFFECELGSQILPEGWDPWIGDAMFPGKEKTVYYAEYNSKGSGAAAKSRVPWSKQLTTRESRQYTVYNVLKGVDNWNPIEYFSSKTN